MVRFLVLYDTPADPEAFDRYYRDVHIPLAKQLPGLRRYTISRNHGPVRGEQSYYLVAELDWDDPEAMRQAFASEIGKATAADVPKFAPSGVRSLTFEVEEV
ncbi:MAG: EthD family reductase [Streptosporangiaceae bacterium]